MREDTQATVLGSYRTPVHSVGKVAMDEIRGEVVITGTSKAPIPWPLARRTGGRAALVVFSGLSEALRRESPRAVAHWWGVSPSTVRRWRVTLGLSGNPRDSSS